MCCPTEMAGEGLKEDLCSAAITPFLPTLLVSQAPAAAADSFMDAGLSWCFFIQDRGKNQKKRRLQALTPLIPCDRLSLLSYNIIINFQTRERRRVLRCVGVGVVDALR